MFFSNVSKLGAAINSSPISDLTGQFKEGDDDAAAHHFKTSHCNRPSINARQLASSQDSWA